MFLSIPCIPGAMWYVHSPRDPARRCCVTLTSPGAWGAGMTSPLSFDSHQLSQLNPVAWYTRSLGGERPANQKHSCKKLFIWLHAGSLSFFFFFAAHGIFSCGFWTFSYDMQELVPQAGIEPGLPAWGAWNLSHGTTGEVPGTHILDFFVSSYSLGFGWLSNKLPE